MSTNQKWKRRLPMWMTYGRILLVPLILGLLLPVSGLARWTALFFFVVASVTDYFDGYFARKYNAVSNLGKFMDPVADKILVTSIMVMLLWLGRIDPWMVIVIMVRDTLVGGIRSVAAADGIVIAAKAAGKWKTALQMGALPALMINELPGLENFPLHKVAYGLLWFSVILSITSGYEYIAGYFKVIKEDL